MSSKSATHLWMVAFVVAGVFAVFFCTPLFSFMLNSFEVNMMPQTADVIVVLGSDINCDTREPDAVGALRIDKGLELFRAGYSLRMTVTDADPARPPGCPTMGDIEKAYIKRNLEGSTRYPALFILNHAKDTRQEALQLDSLARRHGWKKVLLVSSPLHLRRGLMLFAHTGLVVIPIASSEFRYNSRFPTFDDRKIAIKLVAHEVLGFVQAIFAMIISAVS